MDNKKFTRAKNIVEVIKTSTRVSINAMDETIYVDNVPTGLKAEEKLLKKSYPDKGPALFGSVKTLKATTGIPRQKVKYFLHTEPAYTKYRTVRRKIPRLKVIVYDINEIWSIDLAHVDKVENTTNISNII